jgi:antirestriction protein ArdC
MKKDAYDLVTARIVEALDAGIVPWHRPWKAGPNSGPISYSTRKPYQGVNVWTLTATAALRDYESRYWVTFNQARESGGSVRKGETGTPVVFWKFIEKKSESGEKIERIPFLRYFTVFNLDQCDDVPEPETTTDFEPEPFTPIEMAEKIAASMPSRPSVRHGGDRAFYSPALDYVGMPLQVQFESPEHYYGTLFHELVHSTGHESRIGRKTMVEPSPFGSPDYSREELVAEMGAAFLCGAAGIAPNIEHHAGYIASWLRALENDRKMIVTAAGAAQKAADYVLGIERKREEGSKEPSDLGHSHRRNHGRPGAHHPGNDLRNGRSRRALHARNPHDRAPSRLARFEPDSERANRRRASDGDRLAMVRIRARMDRLGFADARRTDRHPQRDRARMGNPRRIAGARSLTH